MKTAIMIILLLSGSGGGIATAEFADMESCLAAEADLAPLDFLGTWCLPKQR